ncbi:hypothetical protein F2Q68_00027086 [Brassica cretica]|uniref:Uncharacterized protein n=1 Tax=Brassica cretica TaxID=69181 RepID=A0A8S9IH37_BRACR|nr:hypothetical protein F2Q68_00027086 [Brassica cretica]
MGFESGEQKKSRRSSSSVDSPASAELQWCDPVASVELSSPQDEIGILKQQDSWLALIESCISLVL